MQFHGFKGLEASTIDKELMHNHFTGRIWILLATQLLEAIHYLHKEAKVLHNDIKCNNILVAQSFSSSEESFQVVLNDFGKATKISGSKRHHLSDIEKLEHMRKYLHISPEVIGGETKQTIFSDMFSFGKVLYHVIDHGCVSSSESKRRQRLTEFAEHCTSPHYAHWPNSKRGLEFFEEFMC